MSLASRLTGVALACLMVALSASSAAADGVHIPDTAFATMPEIPVQRALITWRDGVETLVVESAFTTASPTVGWVLPLPAEPDKLAQADPGMLTSLEMTLGPDLSDDFDTGQGVFAWLLIFIAGLSAICVFSKDSRQAWSASLLWVSFQLLGLCLLPTLGSAGLAMSAEGLAADGVNVRQSQRVGDYEATVLRADTAAALSNWLAVNHLRPLSEAGQRIVDDYIARKWCFVVARLAATTDGRTAVPHPIAATFRAERPVYPMKLTALAGSTTRVELFVAADKQMDAPGFETIVADRFFSSDLGIKDPPPDPEGLQRWYDSRDQWRGPAVGNPDAVALLWDPCTVTHLRADLDPEDMAGDVDLAPVEFEPTRAHHFTTQARRSLILLILKLGGIALAVTCAVVFAYRRRPKAWQVRLLAGLVVAVLATVAVVQFLVPAVPVRTEHLSFGFWLDSDAPSLTNDAAWLAAKGQLRPEMTDAEIIAVLAKEDPAYFIEANPLTGQPVKAERTPGNYAIRREGGRVYFCAYDRLGREYRAEILPPKAGEGTPGP